MATLRPCEAAQAELPANRGRRRRLSPSSVSEPIRNYSITGYFSIMLIEYSAIVNGLSRNYPTIRPMGYSILTVHRVRKLRKPCLLTTLQILYNIDRLWDI